MAISRATIITRNRDDLARPYRRRLDTALLNQENEVRRKVQERVETFGVKEDKILADRSRSDEGKHTAIVALVNDSLESFGFLGRVVADLEGDAQQTRANIFGVRVPPSWGSDAVLQYWRGKEIRDEFRGLQQPQRDSRFLQAAEADHEATLWAVLNTPDDQPLVREEVKSRALEERAKRQNPQAFHRLGQLTTSAEELGGLRDHVVQWLRGLGGNPKVIYAALGGEEPALSPIEVSRSQVQHV